MKGEAALKGAQLGLKARVSQGPEVTGAHREPHRTAGDCQVQGQVSSGVHGEVECYLTVLTPQGVSLSNLGALGLGQGWQGREEVKVALE